MSVIDERNGKDRIEMTLDYSAAEPDKPDKGLPEGNAFMQGSGGRFLQLCNKKIDLIIGKISKLFEL